jgi:NitT/TauT family transport system substrate-binding protein
VQAEDVLTNDFVGPANDFDHDAVKADAEGYALSAEMQALDMQAIEAGLFATAIQG